MLYTINILLMYQCYECISYIYNIYILRTSEWSDPDRELSYSYYQLPAWQEEIFSLVATTPPRPTEALGGINQRREETASITRRPTRSLRRRDTL